MVPRPLAPARAMRSRTCAHVIQPCRRVLGSVVDYVSANRARVVLNLSLDDAHNVAAIPIVGTPLT